MELGVNEGDIWTLVVTDEVPGRRSWGSWYGSCSRHRSSRGTVVEGTLRLRESQGDCEEGERVEDRRFGRVRGGEPDPYQ